MLDQTFAALSDPTRRTILARLSETEGLTVGVVAQPFPVSLPAVIKHLDVLVEAGLVARTRSGRNVTCTLTAGPMTEAMAWLARHAKFWEQRLDALGVVLEQERKTNDDQKRPGRSRGQKPG